MNEIITKTNEKITVKLDYFGKYGQTKTMTVYRHKFHNIPLVKFGKDFYFVNKDGSLYA